jgi:hypothetical protein
MVVATRVNPNAVRHETRRLQIRAWNQAEPIISSVPADAIVDIVAAQLCGFFLNLRLIQTARAIAIAVQFRDVLFRDEAESVIRASRSEAIRLSEAELQQHTAPAKGSDIGASVRILTDHGEVIVDIAAATVDVVRAFRQVGSGKARSV